MRWALLVLMIGALIGCKAEKPARAIQDPHAKDIAVVDEYLQALALVVKLPTPQDVRRAQPALEKQRPSFEKALARMLESGDPRAPSRLVFSQTIQIGAYLEADSALGRAASKLLGPGFPTVSNGEQKLYAPADLYLWWSGHQRQFSDYPLLTEWEASSLAKKTVIPMYRELAENRSRRPESSPASP